jgi:hypothetical protein
MGKNMNEYLDWDSQKTPHTNDKARVIKTRNVTDVYAIEVIGGKYRAASLDGVFELVNPPTAKLPGRVLVRCSWFGVTPPTTYPQLDISSATVIQKPHYTGQVVDDISV